MRLQKHYYGFVNLPNYWVDDNDKSYSDKFFDDKTYKDLYFDNFFDMDKMFGHENSLFGTKGLPVGHPERTSRSFQDYNEKYGPMIVRVVKDRNLQEQVSRMKSMMGVISETNFFRRRVAPSEIFKYFPTFGQETFDQFDVKNYKDFKYNLVIRILEYIMWRDFEIGWEDLPEQDEINYVNTVTKMYNDEIEKLYNDIKNKNR